MKRKPKSLSELYAIWNKKLAKSGFVDIEDAEGRLITWEKSRAQKMAQNIATLGMFAKRDYFRMAGFFLHEHEFQSEMERKIWSLYAEGKSRREIAEVMKQEYPKLKINIRWHIETLEKAMFERYRDEEGEEDECEVSHQSAGTA